MGSGLIQNRISLEVSTLRRGSGGLPAVDRRTIEGTALLQSGDTVILGGGLYLHQEEQERRGPLRARWLGPLRPLTEGRLDDGDLRELVFLLCAEHVDASELTAQPPT